MGLYLSVTPLTKKKNSLVLMVFLLKKIILIIKYINALVPHIYVTRLPVKWTEDEKKIFQKNAFSVFPYCSTA